MSVRLIACVGLVMGGVAAELLAGAPAGGEIPPRVTPEPGPVKFVAHRLNMFRSEAVGVADFNRDGKLDIIAGNFLYLAPDFKPQQIRTIPGKVDDNGKGYHDDFMNAPLDVDGDGLPDLVTCTWFAKRLAWYRNPGKPGEPWAETVIDTPGNLEAGDLWDITGQGKAVHVLPHAQKTFWFEPSKSEKSGFAKHVVSEKAMTWGGGVGDVNGDGRPDILRPNAWFEAPADPRAGTWKEHPLALGESPQIWVMDVNGDGRNDIITGSAHGRGLSWWEQAGDRDNPTWTRHVIDDNWTQVHAITLADLDGDGALDVVAGKRFMAHNGSDPDETGPLGVYWYKLKKGPAPQWTKYAITYNEGIGSGLNIVVVDLDGDGDQDVVVTGKYGGPVWFENKTK